MKLEKIERQIMHANRGFTAIFRNIEKKDDYKIDWLKKTIKELMENQTRIHSRSSVNFEYIVEPIINVFDDYRENNTLAIVMGYNYLYSSEDHYPHQFEKEILGSLEVLINSEYKGVLYCIGLCQDVPYVGRQKSEELFGGLLFQKYVGPIPSDASCDLYAWNVVSERRLHCIDNSIIYSIFQEEKITLPKSKMNF